MDEKEKDIEKPAAAPKDEDYTLQDDSSSLAEVEEILEFYKDKSFEDTDEEINELEIEEEKSAIRKKTDTFFSKFKRKPSTYTASKPDNEELHDSSYGITKKSRIILTYAITAVVCGAIIGGAFLLAVMLPGDEEETEKFAAELRSHEDYVTLKSDYDSLKAETDELRASVDKKKEMSDNLDDYENTQADLRAQIDAKKGDLDSVNAQIAEKQETLNTINTQISEKSESTITLPPGRYVVGKDIAARAYTVMGTGSFAVASEDNTNKYNTTLGSSPFAVTLNQGDKLKFDSTVKFTPLR